MIVCSYPGVGGRGSVMVVAIDGGNLLLLQLQKLHGEVQAHGRGPCLAIAHLHHPRPHLSKQTVCS